MKVDLGQCAVCGAKNSKYVEKCYKCGAALPWASGYAAPKTAPQKPTPQPAQPVRPAAPSADGGAKTVVTTPIDNAPADNTRAPTIEPVASDNSPTPSVAQRAQKSVQVPAWALGAGGLGLIVLGMGLWALSHNKPVEPALAPAPIATSSAPALAPIVPAVTSQPTAIADANAVAVVVAPTPQTTAQTTPAATPIATPIATTEATIAAPPIAAGMSVAPEIGPTFDELYANLNTGTPQQQALYWESVKNKKINWRGEFVSLGSAATGPLIVNCKTAKGALKVTVHLDAANPQTLQNFAPNQSVPFSGILESRNAAGVTVKDARVG